MHTDGNACDCTLGCMDTVIESVLKVDSGGRAGPLLYQLSYFLASFEARFTESSPACAFYLKS